MWAKQDHITKISINMSPSKDFSLKRSDWAARSFCPRAFLFTGSQSHPSFLHFTVTCSPPLHPLLSHSLYIHQSATLNCSPWTPLSLTSLCSPALPFSTPSYFSPEHSSSVSTALPFRPFVPPPPPPSPTPPPNPNPTKTPAVPPGILLSTSDKCRWSLLSFEDRWAPSVKQPRVLFSPLNGIVSKLLLPAWRLRLE